MKQHHVPCAWLEGRSIPWAQNIWHCWATERVWITATADIPLPDVISACIANQLPASADAVCLNFFLSFFLTVPYAWISADATLSISLRGRPLDPCTGQSRAPDKFWSLFPPFTQNAILIFLINQTVWTWLNLLSYYLVNKRSLHVHSQSLPTLIREK